MGGGLNGYIFFIALHPLLGVTFFIHRFLLGEMTPKNCAASALDDEQVKIKELTLIAAKKEGLSPETNITAICDGARNCWNFFEHLSAHCRSILSILDWFHIAMKFKNLGHCDTAELDEKIDHAKWCLWNGHALYFVIELMSL